MPFFSTSGSEFVEVFVGVGAGRVRKMFEAARAAAPSVIFIDELDSIGRRRGTGLGGGNDEREQTLNQILAEMDGFDEKEAVVVLAATKPPRRAGPRPPAARALRQACHAHPARQGRAARDPRHSCPRPANGGHVGPRRHRVRDARLFRRGPEEPAQTRRRSRRRGVTATSSPPKTLPRRATR